MYHEAHLTASGVPYRSTPLAAIGRILPRVLALAGEVAQVLGSHLGSESDSIVSSSEQFWRGDNSKRIEYTTRHPLYCELETMVLGEERGEDHVQDEVRRVDEGRQIGGLVVTTATFGLKVMYLMGPSNALHWRQLQLAGNRVVLCHEVFFAPEAALADLCDAPRTTQTGAETKFVDSMWSSVLFGGPAFMKFLGCATGVTSLTMISGFSWLKMTNGFTPGGSVTSSQILKFEISSLGHLVWAFHLSQDGTSMTLISSVGLELGGQGSTWPWVDRPLGTQITAPKD